MRKGDTNRGEEFIYKLSLNEEFEKDIAATRAAFGIPERGIKTTKEEWIWSHSDAMDTFEYFDTLKKFCQSHKIPMGYEHSLESYILYGINSKLKLAEPTVARIVHPQKIKLTALKNSIEGYYQRHGEPYAKILVFGNGSKSDVLRYIEKNWSDVEDVLKKQGWNKLRKIKKTIYKERNIFIKQLWRKSINDLQELADQRDSAGAPHNSRYRDLLIQIILKKEFGEIGEGYIRKISSKNLFALLLYSRD